MKTRQLSLLEKKILLNRGWLTTQSTDFSNALLEVSRIKEFQAGQTIFFEGDEMDGLDGLISGSVGVYSAPTENPPVLYHIAGPGLWTDGGRVHSKESKRVVSPGSGSVFFAITTPVGPLQLGIGAADNGQFNYYARIGHPFRSRGRDA